MTFVEVVETQRVSTPQNKMYFFILLKPYLLDI